MVDEAFRSCVDSCWFFAHQRKMGGQSEHFGDFVSCETETARTEWVMVKASWRGGLEEHNSFAQKDRLMTWHGDREAGFIHTGLRLNRKVVVGH
jgi:hypothetical protein